MIQFHELFLKHAIEKKINQLFSLNNLKYNTKEIIISSMSYPLQSQGRTKLVDGSNM